MWLGCSVENQEQADKRIPELLKCRDLSPVLFSQNGRGARKKVAPEILIINGDSNE